MAQADNRFLIRLNEIEARIDRAFLVLREATVACLEGEARDCVISLKCLQDYALDADVDLSKHYDKLLRVKENLAKLAQRIDYKRRPRWRRVVAFFVAGINLVASILGIGAIIRPRMLPGSQVRGYLPSELDSQDW
ncbi:MAG: hypothetical protein HOP29_16730 [Phycisphaerales bacterium]|nr:hypothetical protein [Phycisphaerales bacterium]